MSELGDKLDVLRAKYTDLLVIRSRLRKQLKELEQKLTDIRIESEAVQTLYTEEVCEEAFFGFREHEYEQMELEGINEDAAT